MKKDLLSRSLNKSMNIVYAVLLFLASQAFLVKGYLPQKYQKVRLRYYLIFVIGLIIGAAVTGQWLGIGRFLVVTLSVLASSLLIYRFQAKYEEMEHGKI